MEKMSSERDETETAPHLSTAPSTPGVETNKMSRMFDSMPLSPGLPPEIAPDHPLKFAHLISPILRADLPAYYDFAELLKISRALNTHNRSSSGTATNSRNVSGASGSIASSSYPSLPGAFGSAVGSSSPASPLPALKDAKFYKRSMSEDIEPTLRLDVAPGLSWMARRHVLTAITSGTLVVEPFVSQSKFYGPVYACALCGEDRRQESYARRHRFRITEDASAQRYPLCEYCLGRVRATGDFAGFLRMVRDGLWRAKTDEDVKAAWEESVRLREKMFWARIGGGVVPCSSVAASRHEQQKSSMEEDEVVTVPEIRTSIDASPETVKAQAREEDPFESNAGQKRVSIGRTTIERMSLDGAKDEKPHGQEATKDNVAHGVTQHESATAATSDTQSEEIAHEERNERIGSMPGGFDD